MKISSFLINKRRIVQLILAILLYAAIGVFKLSLIHVALVGIGLGIIFGKVFCRWMCPIGFIMELMMLGRNKNDVMQQNFMYNKIGCPIAWVSGFLNKYSLFKIKKDSSNCISCGKCDKTCYISSIDFNYSVHNPEKSNAGESFKCSKCLECVETCPVNSLKFKPSLLKKRK